MTFSWYCLRPATAMGEVTAGLASLRVGRTEVADMALPTARGELSKLRRNILMGEYLFWRQVGNSRYMELSLTRCGGV